MRGGAKRRKEKLCHLDNNDASEFLLARSRVINFICLKVVKQKVKIVAMKGKKGIRFADKISSFSPSPWQQCKTER